MTDTTSKAAQNKALVLKFCDLAFVQKKIRDAYMKYVGTNYVQHNPTVPDGREGAIGFLEPLLVQYPQLTLNVKRVIADDEYVVVHHHATITPDDIGTSVVDIFRVEGDKIVAHWDIIQQVPTTEIRNNNSMF